MLLTSRGDLKGTKFMSILSYYSFWRTSSYEPVVYRLSNPT